MRSRRLTLGTKLLIGLGGFSVLVAALLLLGDQIIRAASERLEETLNAQVRPLAQMNRLQSQVNRIRVLEIELPRLTDVFAVSERLDRLRGEQERLDVELAAFIAELRRHGDADAVGLEQAWSRYRADLKEAARHADAMRLDEVQKISTFESSARFQAISRTLKGLAEKTETRAAEAFARGLDEHGGQRRMFVLTSIAGLLVLALLTLVLARSISGRLKRLLRGAAAIAEGRADRPVEVSGNDEIADLGAAFNAMHDKVYARERALHAAQDELESRVEARTRELNDANALLHLEVDERRRAEEQLRLLSQAVEQSPVGIVIADPDGMIEYVNHAFVHSTGLAAELVRGRPAALIVADGSCEADRRRHWAKLLAGKPREVEFRNRRDGSALWLHLGLSPVHDGDGAVTHHLMIAEDITLRKEQQEKILHQAQYDSLTELPNRMLAMDRLSQAMVAAERTATKVVLMFIDLDDFKKVNDTLGHDTGDLLLVQAARRLRAAVRGGDTVARLGGDEFLVIMGGLHSPADAETVAEKIVQAFSPSFAIGDSEVVVSPSMGLAVYPDDGEAPGTLLRHADLAMYDAKEAGRNTYRFFNRQVHDSSVRRLALERRLRGALERGELHVVYQPMVATAGTAIVGAEALLRWFSPEFGLVPPDQFIPIAERTGVIVEIGDWVLRTACAQARAWRTQGLEDFSICVNVSPRQFRGDALLASVAQCLREFAMPIGSLHVEVTEGVLIRNSPEVRQILDALTKLGVRLAMDDFGTGYSSLSYLKRFPFHTLKIDREFIRDLATDPDDRALVTAAIRMGKGLGLTVVAEGVETAEQLAFLTRHDCDVVQGYYFGKPMAADEFAARWVAHDDATVAADD